MSCLSGEECTVFGTFLSFVAFLSLPSSSDQQDQHQNRPRRGVIIPPPDWPDWARAGRAGCQVLVCDESMAATLTQDADHRRQREHLLPA